MWILYQIFLAHKKNSTSRNKICWIPFQLFESIKSQDFEHCPRNILPPKMQYLVNLFLYLNMSLVFSMHAVLFALYYSNLLIYCQCSCMKKVWILIFKFYHNINESTNNENMQSVEYFTFQIHMTFNFSKWKTRYGKSLIN